MVKPFLYTLENMGSIPRTHCHVAWHLVPLVLWSRQKQVDRTGSLASQPNLLNDSKPVRDPISKTTTKCGWHLRKNI